VTLTLTASVEADHTPPRVRLDVNDTTGTVPSVTITRLDPDSVYRKVRTSDDAPLPLSGGLATIYDYEAPFGYALTYMTDLAGSPTATVQIDSAQSWLVHLGVPSRSCPIEFAPGSFTTVTRTVPQGVFVVLERPDPVVASGGARLLGASQFVLMTETISDLAALDLLFSDGSTLFLNVPPSLGYDVDSMYVAPGDVVFGRPSSVATHKDRTITVPYQTVGRPSGGTQAAITWNDVATRGADDYTAAPSSYATWAAAAAAADSWAELAAPTS